MKLILLFCFVALSACNSPSPSHMDPLKAREVIKDYLNQGKKFNKSGTFEPIIRNEKSAIKVAEAILFEIYGEEQIKSERPYTIGYAGDYWILHGYLPDDMKGGVFEIIINSKNGEVVDLSHGK